MEANRDLRLAQELKRLDTFECPALDDIGYVQHDRAEMEVLFSLLAERYERKSVRITSNLILGVGTVAFISYAAGRRINRTRM